MSNGELSNAVGVTKKNKYSINKNGSFILAGNDEGTMP